MQVQTTYGEYLMLDIGWGYRHDKANDRNKKAEDQREELKKAYVLA